MVLIATNYLDLDDFEGEGEDQISTPEKKNEDGWEKGSLAKRWRYLQILKNKHRGTEGDTGKVILCQIIQINYLQTFPDMQKQLDANMKPHSNL